MEKIARGLSGPIPVFFVCIFANLLFFKFHSLPLSIFFFYSIPFVYLPLPSVLAPWSSHSFYSLPHPLSPLPPVPTPISLFPQLTGGSSAQAFVSKHVEGINWLQRLALSTRLPLCGCHLALTPTSLSLSFSLLYFDSSLPPFTQLSFSFILTPRGPFFLSFYSSFLFLSCCALFVLAPL